MSQVNTYYFDGSGELTKFFDDFPGTSLDTGKWTDNSGSGVTISVDNGTLTIDDSSDWFAYLQSASFENFASSTATIHVSNISGTPFDNYPDTGFRVHRVGSDSNEDASWWVDTSGDYRASNEISLSSLATVSSSDANYLRIRHDISGTVHWEYSLDGDSWTEAASEPVSEVFEGSVSGDFEVRLMLEGFIWEIDEVSVVSGGISDPDNAWSDPSNAFDGDTGTFAQISTTGSDTNNYLEGIGTTAPESGADITQVRARVITEFQTGTWRTFTEPAGGWDWDIISSLKTRAWYETGEIDIIVAYIYDGDTQLAPETFDPIAAGNINPKLATIELEVTSEETVGDTHQQDVSDSLEVVDEASRVITKHLIDTVEASDDFSRTLQAERTFDDSVEITDELDAEQIGAITEDITTGGGLMLGGISLGSLSPAQTFFETLQIQEEWENDHADFLAVHDDLFQRLVKGVHDSIEVDDDIDRTAGFERAFDDGVGVSDILGKNMAKSASDGLSLDDTLAKQVEKAHSDSIELEDTVSKAVERVLSDQVDIVDDFTKFTGYLRKLEDTVEVSDELHATTEVTHRVGNADILAVTDEVSRKIIKHIDDSVVISDTINARIIWISDPARPRSVYAISPKGDKQTFAPGTDPASGNFSPSPRREVTDWTVSDDPSQGNWNGA